jgi:hypothetical protein
MVSQKHWLNDTDKGSTKKNTPVPVPLCPSQISHVSGLGLNHRAFVATRPATNRRSHGTARRQKSEVTVHLYPMLLDIRQSTPFWKDPRLCHFSPSKSEVVIMSKEHWWNDTDKDKAKNWKKKPVPLPLCTPQIPHQMTWDLTPDSALISR